MERQDGRDPFDPQTYYSENGGLTITTMVELRVFCASFFESHVRHNMNRTPTEMMNTFIKLITDSDFFFARARAVIPELQVPNTVCFHENINTNYILLETQKFRGSPGKKWSIHADESAWSKLSNDGRAMLEKKASEQRAQGSDVSAHLVTSGIKLEDEAYGHKAQAHSVSVQSLAPKQTEAKGPRKQASNTSAPASPPSTTKAKPNLQIRTFIPQYASISEQLVWSPTQGTRPRRQDEVYQILATSPASSTPGHREMPRSDAPKENMEDLSRKLTDLHPSLSLHNSTSLSPTSRALGNQSPFGPIGPGSVSRNKHAPTTDAELGNPTPVTLQDSVPNIHGQQKQGGCHRPISVSSGMNSPKHTVNRTRGVPGVDPFSGAPNFAKFQGRHHSGQVQYGRHSKYFQPPLHHQSDAPMSDLQYLVPTSDNGGLLPDQPPAQPLAWGSLYQATGPEHLIIPAQGMMKPIDYWDMLYQMEVDLCERLWKANEPMNQFYQTYIAQLEQARTMAIRTKLPHRGRMSMKMWFLALEREMQCIWTQRPGQIRDNPMIMARKRDYERVVRDELDKAWLEGQWRFP